MLYYEQEICAMDDKPKEQSEFYRRLHDVDPKAAADTLYSVDVALSNGNPAPRIEDE